MKTFIKACSTCVLAVVLALGLAGLSALPAPVLAANAVEYGLITSQITASDLGVDSVGTLPTSPFYFIKEWKRGLTRFFTFDAIAKAELELNITNQIAAEVLEVEKAYDACAANALGGGKSCKPEDEVGAVKNALQNFTNAEERLRFRITTINGTSNVVDAERLLKDVDEKTAKHAVLLEQVSARVTFTRTGTCGAFCRQYEELQSVVDTAQNNTLKTFTATVSQGTGGETPTGSVIFLRQKAADQIASAEEAVKQAVAVYGQAVTFTATTINGGDQTYPNPYYIAVNDVAVTNEDDDSAGVKVTVPKQTQGATFGEKMNAIGTFNALMIGRTAVINGGDLLITVNTTATLEVGDVIRIDNELLIITAMEKKSITVNRGEKGTVSAVNIDGVEGPTGRTIVIELSEPVSVGQLTAGSHTITAQYSGSANHIDKAKSHLADAKKAFSEEKYGEAYGLARSAEAVASGVRVAGGDINGDGRADKTAPVSPTVTPKPSKAVTPKVQPENRGANGSTPGAHLNGAISTEAEISTSTSDSTSVPQAILEKEKTDDALTRPTVIESTVPSSAADSDSEKPKGNPTNPNTTQGAAGSPTL